MANESKTMKKMTEADFDKAIIREPYHVDVLGGLYDNKEESIEITPCITMIYKVNYDDDNHNGNILSYITLTLWDKERLQIIGSVSSCYYMVNDKGEISDQNKALKDQKKMASALIDKYRDTILKVTKTHLKKIKSPLLDSVEKF